MSLLKLSISLICLSLFACNSQNGNNSTPATYTYGTKSVYRAQQVLSSYEKAPDGYHVVYTEMLARHGSRGLTSRKYDDLSLQLWQLARSENGLTEQGKTLGPEIERMMKAHQMIGYGNLSKLGKKEHHDLAQRVALRVPTLWQMAVHNKQNILFEHSGKQRVIDSEESFANSLKSTQPSIAPLMKPAIKNKAQLYFHKQKINQYYQDYKDNDPLLLSKIEQLRQLARTKKVTSNILARIYTAEFIARLANGEFELESRGEDGKNSGKFIRNEIDAALILYNLAIIAPGMRYEAGESPWKFESFIKPEEAAWLSYLDDANTFYEKGPSFSDSDITYRMANVLVDDFFKEVEQVANNSNRNIAKFRFAHAEIVIPFAAALKLQGSEQGISKDLLYTQSNNPWRGEWVSPLAANIQWDVYRDTQNHLLVTMFYNEKQIKFKAACRAYQGSDYYYQFSELKRCYQR